MFRDVLRANPALRDEYAAIKSRLASLHADPMYGTEDSTAPRGLRGWWASPPRTGMARLIAPWEYRHLRGFAGVRVAAGIVLVGLGVVTLGFGGADWQAYGWALFFLALAAGQFSFAYWLRTLARSETVSS